jgi:hypothetical protein
MPSPGTDYLSMAFVAPLGVGAMANAANQAWLNDIWDLVVATPVDAEGYYENTLKLLAMLVMSGNWWPPEGVSGGCTPDGTPLCTNGGYISDLQIKIGGVGGGSGDQSLKIKGKLFFPQGNPAPAPFTDGAQLLIEDMGSGAAHIFDVTNLTTAVPPASAGACDDRDGWAVKSSGTQYRNRSTALDPPSCTPGSSRGLQLIKYKARSPSDLDIQVKANHATIAAPVGPLRLTVVLGATQAAGDAGHCALSASLDCTNSGSSVRCR